MVDSSHRVAPFAEHLLDVATVSNSNDSEGEQRYAIVHGFFYVVERLPPASLGAF
jgi:hypothetical protein